LGYDARPPTPDELAAMQRLTAQAMEEGAMGVSSALIYAPATFAGPDELQALARVAARYGGMYISHIRNEGNTFLEALDELLDVARATGGATEIYHLKASGRANWGKMDDAIAKIDAARAAGLPITADMYTYHASGTGLDASMPPWVQEGGEEAWIARLQNPAIRERVIREMQDPAPDWDNTYLSAGAPERVILVGFKTEALRPLIGKTLAEVAAMRGQSPEATMVDLVIEDHNNVDAIYFTMSEDNIRKKIAQPWMSFCSDGASQAPEGVFLRASTHPRAYGSFARLLGRYVREEQVIPLAEAIRRLTSLPAQNLKLQRRGLLRPGYFADVVVFDPDSIQDHATFSQPHQYATGVEHVFVNGVQVLKEGEHTGAMPGRVVRGPGWRKR
jgi:N-acyl-D-amino-acid deacylase